MTNTAMIWRLRPQSWNELVTTDLANLNEELAKHKVSALVGTPVALPACK